MGRDGDNRVRVHHDEDLSEVEANIRVLVEAELTAQHELDPHAPPVAECPTCRRLAMGA